MTLAERLHREHPRDLYFLRDLAEVHEAVARFRLARGQALLADESVKRADELWQQWPRLAVSSVYDEKHRGRLDQLLREIRSAR
jgi:hypothetical protein